MHTEHLYIRPFTLADAEQYWPLVRLPEVLRYTGEQAHASLDAVRRTLLERPLKDYAVHGYGRMACIEKSTGRLVGFSGLKYLEELNEVDIGYRFLPDCWGKGYAPRARGRSCSVAPSSMGSRGSSAWSNQRTWRRRACLKSSACCSNA